MKQKLPVTLGIFGIGAFVYLLETQALLGVNKTEPTDSIKYHETKCPIGTSDSGYSLNSKPVCELTNIITNDLKLTKDKYWHINGEVHVGGDNNFNASLLIEEGTTLFGNGKRDFLIINRGSKVIAVGTKLEPITFTSLSDIKNENPKSGDWGGLVIAGNAIINTGNFDEEFEFSKKKVRFGGVKENDNSGILKYVVIKYAGAKVTKDKELNGLSLGGVGRGTYIDYVEVYKGKDDGIELWGGNVNMKHILLIGNRDDSLDTDLGYSGMIQYLYAEKLSIELSESGSAIESDNNGYNYNAMPRTNPIISNFELLGSMGSKYGVVLRKGSGYKLFNGIVSGFDIAQLVIRDRETIVGKNIEFSSVALGGSRANNDLYDGSNGVSKKNIAKIFENSQACKIDAYITSPTQINPKSFNAFFDKALFVGAYDKDDDWRVGWSVGIEKRD